MTVLNAPPTTVAEPPEPSVANPPPDDGRPIVIMIVANAFCRDDGWHDIRVHKFAKTFQQQGLRPIVFCRTHGQATSARGVYDGIEYRRMLFKAPRVPPLSPAAPIEVAPVPVGEPSTSHSVARPPTPLVPVQPNAIERLIARIDPGVYESARRPRRKPASFRQRRTPWRRVLRAGARIWFGAIPATWRGQARRRWLRLTDVLWRFTQQPGPTFVRSARVITCKGLRFMLRVARRLRVYARRTLRLARRVVNRIRTLLRRTRNRTRTLIRRSIHWGRVRVRRARSAMRRLGALGPRARRRFNTTYLNFLNSDFTRAVLEATDGDRPAFVYAADLNCLLAGHRVSRRSGVPFLYDSHEYFLSRAEHEWMHWSRRAVDRWLCRRLENRLFPEIETTIGVSESIVDAFRERVPSGRYLCVRNLPINESGPPPLERTSVIVDELGLDPSTRIALYIGFITGGRGITEIIESAKFLPDGVVIAMLGGGRQLEEQQEYARTLGVADSVRFLGQVPQADVLRYAAAADCGLSLIQPTCLSYEWSLPNKIFQYIHGGLPVLCSDFPDMGDVVRTWGVGTVVDPTIPRKIAAAIAGLVADPAELARMRANCRAAVEAELNWDQERQKILSIGFVRDAASKAASR